MAAMSFAAAVDVLVATVQTAATREFVFFFGKIRMVNPEGAGGHSRGPWSS